MDRLPAAVELLPNGQSPRLPVHILPWEILVCSPIAVILFIFLIIRKRDSGAIVVQSSDESLDMKAKGGEGGRGQWTVGSLEALRKSKVEPESPIKRPGSDPNLPLTSTGTWASLSGSSEQWSHVETERQPCNARLNHECSSPNTHRAWVNFPGQLSTAGDAPALPSQVHGDM
ncbi:hypothetical protein MDA_GLEAN10018642 [Myotis davidii]|uniref:Uncharacterized protein n=1 Tax=Myotis davidii TaxID=225400 RepID=L5M5I5_MYODS|nr:hypothetical protein MDA_GLEAN10018642 [Myotis davidii]